MFLPEYLPQVLINKITLETVNVSDTVNNPHIGEDIETIRSVDKFGGNRFEQIKQEFESFHNKPNERLKVTIDMSIKDVVQQDSVLLTLLNDETIRKYLRIRVIQILDKNVLKTLIENFSVTTPIELDKLKTSGKLKTSSLLFGGHDSKDKPLKSIVLDNDKTRNITHNIDQVYDLTFKQEFVNSSATPKELYYVVYSYIDMEQLAQDFEIDVNTANNNISSNFTIESVIQNGSIVSGGFVFVEQDLKVWAGPVSTDGTDFFKLSTREKLQVIETRHNVINDFRNIGKIEALNIDIDFVQEFFSEKIFEDIVLSEMNLKKNALSELCLTIDEDNNPRGLFSFNVRQFLMNESMYGSLMASDNSRRLKQIYDQTKIKEVNIYRTRIRNNKDINRLGVLNFSTAPFEKNKLDFELIGSINNNDVREVNLYYQSKSDLDSIKHYSFTDEKFNKLSFGLYKYQVVIKVEDGILKFLEGVSHRLNLLATSMTKYYNEASDPVSYNISSNTFSKEFITKQRDKYKDKTPLWTKAVNELINIVSSLDRDGKVDRELLLFLEKLIAPNTGNLEGISTFIVLIDRVKEQLNFVVGSTVSNRNSTFPPKVATRRKSGYIEDLTAERIFFDVVDADILKNKGLNYVEFSIEQELEGLKVITGGKFSERVDDEVSKFFNNPETSFDIKSSARTYAENVNLRNTKFSFLGPFKYHDKKIGDIYFAGAKSNAWDEETLNQIMLNLDSEQFGRGRGDNKSLLNDKAAGNSVIFNSRKTETDEGKTADSKIYVGQNYSENEDIFNTKEESKSDNNIVYSLSHKEKRLYNRKSASKEENNSSVLFNIGKNNNIISNRKIKEQDIKDAPIHIKSLLAATSRSEEAKSNIFVDSTSGHMKTINDKEKAVFDFNYNMLKVVEVLIDYTGQEMRRPRWEKLTIETFNNGVGKELLGRLRTYNGKLIAENVLDNSTVKTYNDYFLIRPLQVIAEDTNESSLIEDAIDTILQEAAEGEGDIVVVADRQNKTDNIDPAYINTGIFRIE